MKQYRSKPVTIDAMQYTKENFTYVCLLLGNNLGDIENKFN